MTTDMQIDALDTITYTQIETLGTEALDAGDEKQALLCALALQGDARARRACVAAIRDAQAA